MTLARTATFLLLTFALMPSCQPPSPPGADPYQAAPKNSSLIIQVNAASNSLEKLQNTRIYSELVNVAPFAGLHHFCDSLYEVFGKEQFRAYLKKRSLLIAVNLSGAEKFDALVITRSDAALEKLLGESLAREYKVVQREYSGAQIFRYYREGQSREYFLSAHRGLIIFSLSQTLLEESIRQINMGFSLREDPAFQKLVSTSNKKDLANVYLNFREAPSLLKSFLPQAELAFMPQLGHWMELDLQVFHQEIIMNGLALLPDQGTGYFSAFANLSRNRSEAERIVPAGAGLWVGLITGNAEQYYRQYRKYLENNGRLRQHEQLLGKLNIDAREHLLNWVDGEFGLFMLPGKEGITAQVAYLSCREEARATEQLDRISEPGFIEGYRGVIFKKIAAENILPRLYGRLFMDFHFPYYFVHDGHALFSDNLSALKGVVNDLLDGKTLAADPYYQTFNANLPAEAHIKIVGSNPAALSLLSSILDSKTQKTFEKSQSTLDPFQRAAMQFSIEDGVAYSNFYLLHAEKVTEKVNRIWSTSLQSKVLGEPKFLINHYTKKFDIAVQDDENRLYLIDKDGKILWSRELDGPILSGIHQVDVFRNNKLQMAFNTAGKMYLVDRLGRDVENFPVQLNEKATAGMGVFDYDNNRTYRLVVPAGKKLINYTLEGKPVKGWDFRETKDPLNSTPQHFSVAGKDVILIQTARGEILQLNRRGEIRFETIDNIPVLHSPLYLKTGSTLKNSEILSIAADGKLYAIRPGSTADELYLEQENPADHFLYFADRYIFTSGNRIFVKSETNPWQAEFEDDISIKPKAMIFRSNFYVGAFSNRAEEIRVFNQQGKLLDGFPVFAQGGFDMGSLNRDNTTNIVTSSEDGTLICYRVN